MVTAIFIDPQLKLTIWIYRLPLNFRRISNKLGER